jgi:anti-anti-sigma factor
VIVEALPGEEGGIRVQLKGQLTFPNIKQFQMEISRILASGHKHLEIDIGDVVYLDSSGLAAFIPVNDRIREAQGSLRITNPRRFIRHVFVSAQLDTVLDIGPSKD